eukprot:403359643
MSNPKRLTLLLLLGALAYSNLFSTARAQDSNNQRFRKFELIKRNSLGQLKQDGSLPESESNGSSNIEKVGTDSSAEKSQGAPSIEERLKDFSDTQLLVKVGFGSLTNPGYLLVDTNSDYTAINEKTCVGCKDLIYDEAGSTSATDKQPGQTITSGRYVMRGDLLKDTVSYFYDPDQTKQHTTNADMHFVALKQPLQDTKWKIDLPNLDGIFGLGLGSTKDQSFLVNSDSMQFSLFLNETNSDLYVGGYDNSLLAQGTESEGYGLHTYDVIGDSWTLELQDARFIYLTFLKSGANKAKISSTEEFIYIPQEDFQGLSSAWKGKSADVNCNGTACSIKQSCEFIASEIGPFKLQFNSNDYFSVEPEQFMYEGAQFGPEYAGNCIFGVMSSDEATSTGTFILGQAFLRNYLTVFDVAKKQISFGIHVSSEAAIRRTYSGGIIALLAISTALLFPLFVLGIYYLVQLKKRDRRKREREAHEQERQNLMSALTQKTQDTVLREA